MLNELKKLIDEQNIDELKTFLATNPELDLNCISNSRASALWWAIIPPKVKKYLQISFEL